MIDIELNFLKKTLYVDEGCKVYPYDDATGQKVMAYRGHVTIGVGFNLDNGIPPDVLEFWLNKNINDAEIACNACFSNFVTLDTVRRCALMNLAYNIGQTSLYKFVKLRAAVEAKDFGAAADELQESTWFTETGARAYRVQMMLESNRIPKEYK